MKKFLAIGLLASVFVYFSPAVNAADVTVIGAHHKHHKHPRHHRRHHHHHRTVVIINNNAA